jgi:uncharacterized membrane protein
MGAGIGYVMVGFVVLLALVLLILGTGPFGLIVLVVAALLAVGLALSRRRGGTVTQGRDRRPTAPPGFPADEIPHQEQATRERGEVFPHAEQ